MSDNLDKYFMDIALCTAEQSKHPSNKVGACIVNKADKIVGTGYNSLPARCNENDLSWSKTYECFAEMNAIMNKFSADLKHCRMYVTRRPCNESTKIILQSGIREVIYKQTGADILLETARITKLAAAVARMFQTSGAVLREYKDPITETEMEVGPSKKRKQGEE